MAVSRALRFQILRRDNHACRYCGGVAPEVKLTVDHVVPTALGGTDDPTNLVTACDTCNGGKSATPPDATHVADVAQDALRWAKAIHWAAAEALADRDARAERHDEFEADWSGYGYGSGQFRKTVPLPADWRNAVDRFLAAGLPMPLLLDCIPIAMGSDKVVLGMRFNYLCGIAWRKVGDLQERAAAAIRDEDADTEDAFKESMLIEAVEQFLHSLPGHIHNRAEGRARHEHPSWLTGRPQDRDRVEVLVDVLRFTAEALADTRNADEDSEVA